MTRYDGGEASETETAAGIAAGIALAQPVHMALDAGVLAFVAPDGFRVEQVDTERYAPAPRRLVDRVTVHDATSLAALWDKHAHEGSEVYADHQSGRITAVLNASPGEQQPAWGDHRVTLALTETEDWRTWAGRSDTLFTQAEFAEIIEGATPVLVEPDAASMLEIAQTFHAQKGVKYESGVQIHNGQVEFGYREEIDAKAGTRGTTEIPRALRLRLQVWESTPDVEVTVLLRWRITDSGLRLGWTLKRQSDIKRAVFDQVLNDLRTALAQDGTAPVILASPDKHR